MNRTVFEAKRTDAAGRIGQLEIPQADLTIETPAMLPVVNPHIQGVDPSRLASEFGADILITNSYVLYNSDELRDTALDKGVHELLDFPGAIMTDSGSFQLAEYGDIDVDSAEILAFQDAIGTDIATPVDVPTPPDATREEAIADLAATTDAIQTAKAYDAGDMLVTAPIQGSTHLDLREQAARDAYAVGLDIYPIGAVVPLLRSYRFDDVARIIDAAKRGLGTDAPVHLFGAGHPMMFSLGVALGCDLFDSAAYALYAKDERYLTTGGTAHLEELSYFPCHCPVCTDMTPQELRDTPEAARHRLLAEHNLSVTFAEIRRVKQAITQGELLELVERRVRAHPRLLDGYRAALNRTDRLEAAEPATGQRPMFYLSSESARRPEVHRHHDRLTRLSVPDPLTLVVDGVETLPPSYTNSDAPQWAVTPPFGPVPPALNQTYPLTAEVPQSTDSAAIEAAVDGINALCTASDHTVTFVHPGWPAWTLERLPDSVVSVDGGTA